MEIVGDVRIGLIKEMEKLQKVARVKSGSVTGNRKGKVGGGDTKLKIVVGVDW